MAAKADCPEGRKGERVQHRANSERIGTITSSSDDAERAWCTVKWDGRTRNFPRVVHRYELRLLPIDGSEFSS